MVQIVIDLWLVMDIVINNAKLKLVFMTLMTAMIRDDVPKLVFLNELGMVFVMLFVILKIVNEIKMIANNWKDQIEH